jgi:pimeloyl-ACP methyl ester carboxylesterase
VLVLVFSLAALPLHRRLLAAALFLRFEGGKAAPTWLARYGEHAVEITELRLPSGTHALLYSPRRLKRAPGMVLAHGIHEQGIRDKRMLGLARALASTGLFVLTPELSDLSHYRVTHAGAETIAEAAQVLAKRLGEERVGVFGISFGGGLALRAACEAKLRSAIGFVVALGAHHDALRVSRFFLGKPALGPQQERASVTPHPYGATVLFQSLFGEKHRGKLLQSEHARLETALQSHAAELRLASPAGCSQAPRVPLYLIHGVGDGIVPFTESLWNARQFGAATEVDVLISPAIAHAEYAPPDLWERLELINFMARVLP